VESSYAAITLLGFSMLAPVPHNSRGLNQKELNVGSRDKKLYSACDWRMFIGRQQTSC
jgi:hypothetical protein